MHSVFLLLIRYNFGFFFISKTQFNCWSALASKKNICIKGFLVFSHFFIWWGALWSFNKFKNKKNKSWWSVYCTLQRVEGTHTLQATCVGSFNGQTPSFVVTHLYGGWANVKSSVALMDVFLLFSLFSLFYLIKHKDVF